MTTAELRKKILETVEPKWFNEIEETINLPYINLSLKFKGLSSIYEFLNKQIEGWEKFDQNLPTQINQSKNYFLNIRNQIDQFLNSYGNQASNYLNSYWNNVRNYIANTNTFPLTYNCPETEFLIKLNQDFPLSFVAAFNFIVGQGHLNINDKNSFIGSSLAYEFSLKDTSQITERRNTEKSSMSKIRNDFQSYLSESETQVIEHLDNSNEKYKEYVKLIDSFKSDKEKLFSEWYEKTKNDFGSFNDDSNKKIKDLENSYEELLRLKKPAEYWNLRGIELNKQGWKSLWWLIGLLLLACIVLYSLLWLTPDDMLKSFFSDDKSLAIRWTIIFVTLISFLAYGIKILTKVSFSSFHLARDAEERERLTYVYLAMVKDASIDKEDRHLIMQSLFSRADTGLWKDDSSPTMPGAGSLFDKAFK